MGNQNRLDPEQVWIDANVNLTELSNNQTLQALLEELDTKLGTLVATLTEGQVTTFHILNETILNEDIADGTITIDKLAPGVIPTGLSDVQAAVPVGAIMPYAGSTAPTGWLLCDGSEVDATNYPVLAALLKTGTESVFGVATSGYFRMPDFKGRSPLGSGAGAGLTTRTLGQTGGAETHTLTEAQIPHHKHDLTMILDWANGILDVGETHPLFGSHANFAQAASVGQPLYKVNTVSLSNTGGNQAHNNVHPFVVVGFIMKADPPLPGDVTLVSPTDTATGVSTTPLLMWNGATNGSSYEYQVDDTSNAFGSIVATGTPSTNFVQLGSALAGATQHWWRVRGVNESGNGNWSSVFSFTTA